MEVNSATAFPNVSPKNLLVSHLENLASISFSLQSSSLAFASSNRKGFSYMPDAISSHAYTACVMPIFASASQRSGLISLSALLKWLSKTAALKPLTSLIGEDGFGCANPVTGISPNTIISAKKAAVILLKMIFFMFFPKSSYVSRTSGIKVFRND